MNLSHRLDQARAKRRQQAVEGDAPTPFDLRMTRDEPIYDGRDLRTGEQMTEERWLEIKAPPPEPALPTWDPRRANSLVTVDLTLDITAGPGHEVIDLRARDETADDVFTMPAWADGAAVFQSESEQ